VCAQYYPTDDGANSGGSSTSGGSGGGGSLPPTSAGFSALGNNYMSALIVLTVSIVGMAFDMLS
jgi:hypothetical protein